MNNELIESYRTLWRLQRQNPAFLALEDGSIFRGVSFGAPVDTVGEVVFNTGMSGYQEILTDPSYAGQFVTLTAPEIGNYGCNAEDEESRDLFLNGLVIHELNAPSNYRSTESLEAYLKRHNKPALTGIDTRRLTLLLRTKGNLKAYLHTADTKLSEADAVAKARAWEGLDNQDYAVRVTTGAPYVWSEKGTYKVAALDFGIKRNILRCLAAEDMSVTVYPAKTSASDILKAKPDGVFLSNGPADPAAVGYAIETIRSLVGKVPIMGICLGHQLLSLACGAKTARLKFGHHGCNHPVRTLADGTVAITSQNHNFAVVADSLPSCLELTHINLNDQTVEGVRHKTEPAFSIQYHPEAAPGPHDARNLFHQFKASMER